MTELKTVNDPEMSDRNCPQTSDFPAKNRFFSNRFVSVLAMRTAVEQHPIAAKMRFLPQLGVTTGHCWLLSPVELGRA